MVTTRQLLENSVQKGSQLVVRDVIARETSKPLYSKDPCEEPGIIDVLHLNLCSGTHLTSMAEMALAAMVPASSPK